MKNVKILVKLRHFIKSLAVLVFLFLFYSLSSAFIEFPAEGDKPNKADSLLSEKDGFPALFATSDFDPDKPYATQLNPKAVPFVQRYLRECGEDLEKMKIWGKPYFDMYDGIFAHYGLPLELKYLSVIKSALVRTVRSRAGAVGPWQIMPDEARRMGLKVNGRKDERKDFMKSTKAAAKILKELYAQFHDWTLVIAAYNCGAGRMRQAIRKAKSKNFWELQAYLPRETRNHVKRFIGTHYLFEGSGGLTTMTASELADFTLAARTTTNALNPKSGSSLSVQISGKYKAKVIAKNLEMSLQSFQKLNPHFDRSLSAGNEYHLRLPAEKIELFNNKKQEILYQSVQSLLNS